LANLLGLPKFEAYLRRFLCLICKPFIFSWRETVGFFLWQTFQDCQSLRRIYADSSGLICKPFIFSWRETVGFFSLANLSGLPKFEAYFTPIPRVLFVSHLFFLGAKLWAFFFGKPFRIAKV
jgi:hypothetical protein